MSHEHVINTRSCSYCGGFLDVDWEAEEAKCQRCGLIFGLEWDEYFEEYRVDEADVLNLEDYQDPDELKPPCCVSCGGPYPLCKSECLIFDE